MTAVGVPQKPQNPQKPRDGAIAAGPRRAPTQRADAAIFRKNPQKSVRRPRRPLGGPARGPPPAVVSGALSVSSGYFCGILRNSAAITPRSPDTAPTCVEPP